MSSSGIIDSAFSFYNKDIRKIRAECNISIFEELKKAGYNLNKLLVELAISKNYYHNYLNGYSVLSMLQFKYIIDYIKRYDCMFTYNQALLIEVISTQWILSRIYETK